MKNIDLGGHWATSRVAKQTEREPHDLPPTIETWTEDYTDLFQWKEKR